MRTGTVHSSCSGLKWAPQSRRQQQLCYSLIQSFRGRTCQQESAPGQFGGSAHAEGGSEPRAGEAIALSTVWKGAAKAARGAETDARGRCGRAGGRVRWAAAVPARKTEATWFRPLPDAQLCSGSARAVDPCRCCSRRRGCLPPNERERLSRDRKPPRRPIAEGPCSRTHGSPSERGFLREVLPFPFDS